MNKFGDKTGEFPLRALFKFLILFSYHTKNILYFSISESYLLGHGVKFVKALWTLPLGQ